MNSAVALPDSRALTPRIPSWPKPGHWPGLNRSPGLTGGLVKTLLSGNLPAGAGQVAWGRTDDAGMTVAPGVYFCRLHVGGADLSRKLVVR